MNQDFKIPLKLTLIGLVGFIGLIVIVACIETVPVGHVKVGTLFGKADTEPLQEGIHLVNPMKKFHSYDCRQRTYKFDQIGIPSRDQLTSTADVSLQWRVDRKLASQILTEVGDADQLFTVHIEPKTRSVLRELGKTVDKAELFFTEEEQARLQRSLKEYMITYCQPKGIIIDDVLLRNIQPPGFIVQAIQQKKAREQEAEKQKAELERFKVEQEQKIATAEVERRAAEEEAKKLQILADARAYEITKINEAVASNPAYVQLESIKAMIAISKNPANQVYFLNGDSQQPLPLMNVGAAVAGQRK